MIWRLHWLEMRGGLFWALGFSIFAAVTNFPFGFSQESLAEFVNQHGVFVAFFTAVMAGGDGLQGQATLRCHPWRFYKLSLPVARRKLVVTRIAATALAAMIICTCVTAAFVGGAVRQGASVDWQSAAVAHLYSLSTVVSVTAVLAALGVFLERFSFMFAAVLVVVVALANSAWISRALLEGRVAWLGLAGLAAVAVTGFAIAVTHAPRQEVT
jgi:hypothetical protein